MMMKLLIKIASKSNNLNNSLIEGNHSYRMFSQLLCDYNKVNYHTKQLAPISKKMIDMSSSNT